MNARSLLEDVPCELKKMLINILCQKVYEQIYPREW